MFALEMTSLVLTVVWLWALIGADVRLECIAGTLALWLGLTVLVTNFGEALTEIRRQAQAELPNWPHHPVKIKWLKIPPPPS